MKNKGLNSITNCIIVIDVVHFHIWLRDCQNYLANE